MKLTASIEGDSKLTEKWLDNLSNKESSRGLNKMGNSIVRSLVRHSPVESGEMANSWDYNVKKQGRGVAELTITNDSHDETDLSVPILVQYGHGIRGGGYVRANRFITRAMESVYSDELNDIIEGLLK